MQSKIFCKTVAKGKQSFYIAVGGKTYFLFQQAYRVSNKEFFQQGVRVDEINKYAGVHSAAVRKTLDKLPTYIRYVEKEYGIAIYNKTKDTQLRKKQKGHKREPFMWKQVDWEVA